MVLFYLVLEGGQVAHSTAGSDWGFKSLDKTIFEVGVNVSALLVFPSGPSLLLRLKRRFGKKWKSGKGFR